jgi:3-oxoacyl-[acyl-carrier protein] reductase
LLSVSPKGASRRSGLVDRNDAIQTVAEMINEENGNGRKIAESFLGDTTDEVFQKQTFDRMVAQYGTPTICVPAAGITRDC